MPPFSDSELRQLDRAATQRAEFEAFSEAHPEYAGQATRQAHPRDACIISNARRVVEMSNALVRADIEGRQRRFSGEALPGFGRGAS